MQMMESKGLLNSAEVLQLMSLVEKRNQVIFAAFEAYEADQVSCCEDDLIDHHVEADKLLFVRIWPNLLILCSL